ncbi:MAG TPA: LysR substrate-binding domain-containing protein [Burkholderiales bacterium]|jgi:LysR family cyn operon transcriptional activator|nr:LysR substrate-binding domain-containing protein [Burkholderiales bacterium]
MPAVDAAFAVASISDVSDETPADSRQTNRRLGVRAAVQAAATLYSVKQPLEGTRSVMEFRHLRYFLAAAQLQSFSQASDRLHITQPTLSHQIKQLEDEIGVQLFDRVGRTVRLTTAGELFRGYAKRMLKEADSALDAIRELGDLKVGKLTIGVLSSFSTYLLPPILAEFTNTYPGIKITLFRLRTGEIKKLLQEGELDFGIAHAAAVPEQIVVDELIAESMALIVGRNHPLFGQASIAFSEVGNHGLILLTPEYNSRQLLNAAFVAGGITPHVAMEMNAIEPVLATVRQTRLSTIISASLVKAVPDLHGIVLKPSIAHAVALYTRRGSHLSAAAGTLVELIRKRFRTAGGIF